MKKLLLISILFSLATIAGAQKKIINVPDIPGYMTLKCDFHIHTVFSDGMVWPTYRVDEAWEDGLDVLAITDHLEYQPKKDYIPTDHDAAFKIASRLAKERNLLLVHSTEITRSMPPGHFNALFIDNASIVYSEDFLQTVKNAVSQGAFIQWNHPGWKSQQPDGIPKIYDIHAQMLENGLLHAVEFFNSNEYYPLVLDWGSKFKVAVTANSDEHDIISESYNDSHRPITLVFAKERSVESVKEAMMDARTLAWFDDILAGPEYLLRAIFEASVTIGKPYYENDTHYWIEVANNSDIPFYLINGGPGTPGPVTLNSNSVTTIRLRKNENSALEWDVKNLMTSSYGILTISLK